MHVVLMSPLGVLFKASCGAISLEGINGRDLEDIIIGSLYVALMASLDEVFLRSSLGEVLSR